MYYFLRFRGSKTIHNVWELDLERAIKKFIQGSTHTPESVIVTTPKGKYYVTMTDRYLSGWGHARGKTNKLVIACDTYDEAQIVSHNASVRGEMKYINICIKKPSYNDRDYLTTWGTKATHGTWFKRDTWQHWSQDRPKYSANAEG